MATSGDEVAGRAFPTEERMAIAKETDGAARLTAESPGAGVEGTSTDERPRLKRGLRIGLLIGLLSGLTAITCCISPVVLALIGVATAAEAVTLGNTLYYTYGWAFRGAGLLVAATAVFLYLRGRRACSIQGARRSWRLLLALVLTGGATYAGLFWFTKYLGIWFA